MKNRMRCKGGKKHSHKTQKHLAGAGSMAESSEKHKLDLNLNCYESGERANWLLNHHLRQSAATSFITQFGSDSGGSTIEQKYYPKLGLCVLLDFGTGRFGKDTDTAQHR